MPYNPLQEFTTEQLLAHLGLSYWTANDDEGNPAYFICDQFIDKDEA